MRPTRQTQIINDNKAGSTATSVSNHKQRSTVGFNTTNMNVTLNATTAHNTTVSRRVPISGNPYTAPFNPPQVIVPGSSTTQRGQLSRRAPSTVSSTVTSNPSRNPGVPSSSRHTIFSSRSHSVCPTNGGTPLRSAPIQQSSTNHQLDCISSEQQTIITTFLRDEQISLQDNGNDGEDDINSSFSGEKSIYASNFDQTQYTCQHALNVPRVTCPINDSVTNYCAVCSPYIDSQLSTPVRNRRSDASNNSNTVSELNICTGAEMRRFYSLPNRVGLDYTGSMKEKRQAEQNLAESHVSVLKSLLNIFHAGRTQLLITILSIQQLSTSKNEIMPRIQHLQSEIANYTRTTPHLSKTIESMQVDTIPYLTTSVTTLNKNNAELQSSIDEQHHLIENLRKKVDKLTQDNAYLRQQYDTITSASSQLADESAEFQEVYEQIMDQIQAMKCDTLLQDLQQYFSQLNNDFNTFSTQYDQLKHEVDFLASTHERTKAKLDTLQIHFDQTSLACKESIGVMTQHKYTHDSLTKEYSQQLSQFNTLYQDNETASEMVLSLQQKNSHESSQFNSAQIKHKQLLLKHEHLIKYNEQLREQILTQIEQIKTNELKLLQNISENDIYIQKLKDDMELQYNECENMIATLAITHITKKNELHEELALRQTSLKSDVNNLYIQEINEMESHEKLEAEYNEICNQESVLQGKLTAMNEAEALTGEKLDLKIAELQALQTQRQSRIRKLQQEQGQFDDSIIAEKRLCVARQRNVNAKIINQIVQLGGSNDLSRLQNQKPKETVNFERMSINEKIEMLNKDPLMSRKLHSHVLFSEDTLNHENHSEYEEDDDACTFAQSVVNDQGDAISIHAPSMVRFAVEATRASTSDQKILRRTVGSNVGGNILAPAPAAPQVVMPSRGPMARANNATMNRQSAAPLEKPQPRVGASSNFAVAANMRKSSSAATGPSTGFVGVKNRKSAIDDVPSYMRGTTSSKVKDLSHNKK